MDLGLSELGVRDWSVIIATIAGPILAVQAQKWLERLRERRNRKLWVFQQLMATRASRLSNDHVQALNMIDLVFYGTHFFGIHRRTKGETSVVEAWHEYHDHLGNKFDDSTFAIWNTKGDELFINLLFAIATDVHFKFDRVQLKKGSYSPIAHGNLEHEQNLIRKSVLKLLAGQSALKMEVTSFPMNEDVANAQATLQKAMSEAFAGRGALNVIVKGDGAGS
ncbi:hypothetical protein GCM10011487_33110 [Steroidobacter agaridevorans]|uniref:DUF6680 domain-containing protein n=1 Tax=Steroidobacter agaridevorans TaxID=2695856 RepID=A0A829YET9_9GAMM|nr:DUF6680 family protein [Steroidobacter agaridevorans]GFE81311.1 hypothetical protein GCM10011487_33110 [Steroidobacter agaridevorans]GFE88807.1 hypothetical protein GCM10011488_37610 [Steroidobacter agaridevorans]